MDIATNKESAVIRMCHPFCSSNTYQLTIA
jgi:hypothetical protein